MPLIDGRTAGQTPAGSEVQAVRLIVENSTAVGLHLRVEPEGRYLDTLRLIGRLKL
jgi:hypothetical protein